MAKDKTSFILYCDIISTIGKLSDEQAGKLFKHILAYVNDNNPVLDDLLLEIAFEPIKQSLKRDLIKYGIRQETARLNGLKGGRPKKQEKANESQITQSVISKAKKAVSVSVSVSESVSVIKEKDLSFDDFYSEYPIKKGKAVAEKKWKGMINTERIKALTGIEHYKNTVPSGINYCHPATYLNQKRWEDEVSHNESYQQALTPQERLDNSISETQKYIDSLQ